MHVRDWLFSLETIGIKLGLSQISRLLEALGHPEGTYRAITVAGTNGKGSVTAMIERGLRAAGYATGRYTSPHLVHIEERIAVNGTPITADAFTHCAERVREAAGRLEAPPSFFEATTALALLAFRDAGVHTAVLEVGLGGRLDATNAVHAEVAVITAIDYDHQEYLGTTLPAIAREKAGIIKAGARVIVAGNPPEVMAVIEEAAHRTGATLVEAVADVRVEADAAPHGSTLRMRTPVRAYPGVHLRLPGRHQIANAVVAVRALETLEAAGWPSVGPAAIATALRDVEWPARLEWGLWHGRPVLIDGAHNPAGAAALASFLEEMVGHPVPVVVGVMRDKAADAIITALAPRAAVFVTTAAPSPRAMPAGQLAAICRAVAGARPVQAVDDPLAAVEAAAAQGTPVVIAGSLYLAGHIRAALIASA